MCAHQREALGGEHFRRDQRWHSGGCPGTTNPHRDARYRGPTLAILEVQVDRETSTDEREAAQLTNRPCGQSHHAKSAKCRPASSDNRDSGQRNARYLNEVLRDVARHVAEGLLGGTGRTGEAAADRVD